jgi:hypothetical protein
MGSDSELAVDNRRASRFLKFAPPTISILATLLIFALSLGTYYLHYFPYEDDFSLIRYSAVQNSPTPITWITRGFSEYFANDPRCVTNFFGFVRPVVNATYYLESLLYRSAEGPFLLATNFLCWLVSAWFVYGIARRLGTSRWIASSGILLFAMSPCWYRGLIHSSFRNNGLATCFLLAASFVLLDEHAVRSWRRLMGAGGLVALAVGSHEQALTSLPVFVLGVAWLSFKTEREGRMRRMAIAIAAVTAPSLLMVSCFRLMNPMYGSNYATAGLLGTLGSSDRLTALGIHNPLLIGVIKLPVHVFRAIIDALNTFTPLGADNMAKLNPHVGVLIFALVGTATVAVLKRNPQQMFPVTALILYAVGRSLAMPLAEPRFMHMEVAWGIIVLLCALSAGFASGNWIAIITGVGAALGLLAFNIVSYNATILRPHTVLLRRNEVDREAFHRIRSAAAKYPSAQVILANDQAAMWSARAMLDLAGFTTKDFEILPTINNAPSTDVLRDFTACPVTTQVSLLPTTLQVRLFFPKGCSVSTFGRDIACTVKYYRINGRPYAAAWSACLQQTMNIGPCFPPLIDDMPIQSGRTIVVIAWRDRLSVPDVRTLSDESELAFDSQVMR